MRLVACLGSGKGNCSKIERSYSRTFFFFLSDRVRARASAVQEFLRAECGPLYGGENLHAHYQLLFFYIFFHLKFSTRARQGWHKQAHLPLGLTLPGSKLLNENCYAV